MVDPGGKGSFDYRSLLDDDDEDSDNDDVTWKRKKSPSSSSTTVTCVSGDDHFSRRSAEPFTVKRSINFDEEILKQPITRTITRTIEVNKPPPIILSPSPSKISSPSESVWKRLSFPDLRNRESPQPSTSTSTQRVNLTSLKPPSSFAGENELSPPIVQRKPITPPSSSDVVRSRLAPMDFETPVQQRPPIPDTLEFKAPLAPPRPKYHSDRHLDLDTFVKQIKAEMLFHQSLDRIYNRSLRELPAMKAIPEFEGLVKKVIEGVLFDPEVELNEDTVHKVLKILDLFDLDNTSTWTFLIDHCYTLITKNADAHYVRMAKFIEMSFNHLFAKKIRLLPATALSLFKLAQVRPFDPEKKPTARIKLGTIKADLSGIKPN
ncbi:uncharacterized protein LOC128388255 [Panonychus citri]|uniref:uncharacterized protein LOC128388255 n=1 Tax=Panonychus citri TaxID=50023 RepID=UPI002306FDDF|nr:uncharacterized protein LOC128388255 [Panonychus citri]